MAALDRRLENGPRVIVLGGGHHVGAGVVAVQLWIKAGTSAEREDEHGCAHLLEHMTFKPYPVAGGETDLALAIEELGGDVNAFTSHDETVFHATVPAAAGLDGVGIVLDAVLGPRIDPEELARERQVVIEEIKQYDDDPGSCAMQDLVGGLFRGDSYARPVLGKSSEVRSHDAKRLRRYHREVYAGDKLCLVVAGPVDPARVWSVARARLRRVPARSRRLRRERPGSSGRAAVRVRAHDVNEVAIRLGWVGAAFGQDDTVALDVLAIALGQGDASRLMVETRRRDQLVSDVHASSLAFARAGTFLVSAQTTADKALESTRALVAQVDELRRSPLEPEEFARARAVLESGLVYRRETVQGQAHTAGHVACGSGRLEAEDEYYARLDRLTPEQVRVVAARYLARNECSAVLVVPEAELEPPARKELTREVRRVLTRKRSTRGRKARRDRHGVWHTDLPCGLRVRVLPVRDVPIAAGWLIWPGGLRLEDPKRAGISYLSASLLIRGTERRSGDAIAREIDGLAAILDGFSGRNSLGLQFESLAQHLPAVMARTLECAAMPSFPVDELEDERRVALQELEAEADDMAQVAYMGMLRRLYGKHPYHRNVRGSAQTLGRLRRDQLLEGWREAYPLGRAVLAIAGDLEVDVTVERLGQIVDELTGGTATAPPRIEWPGKPPRWPRRPALEIARRVREQSHVVMGFPAFSLGDPRAAALDVLLTVLGGQAGRLFEALREREGLVYHVGATSTEGIDAGHVTIYASMSHEKRERALEVIDRELERIVATKVDPSELARARSWLCGQHDAGNQRRARLASHLAFGEVYELGVGHYLDYGKRIQKVTAAAVRRVAQDVLDPSRCVTSIVQTP